MNIRLWKFVVHPFILLLIPIELEYLPFYITAEIQLPGSKEKKDKIDLLKKLNGKRIAVILSVVCRNRANNDQNKPGYSKTN